MLSVRIARIDTLAALGDDTVAPAWLGVSERRRWEVLTGERRREFAAGRRVLRDTLALVTGRTAGEWDIAAEDGAGPVVRGPARVHASVSHRLGWVAAAVSDAPVGVDLELARPSRSDAAARAALMLGSTELATWRALAPERREAALLTAWTAKEAWFKANPPGAVPWDFRCVVARACAPAQANVRVWDAPPLHVAVCTDDPGELARVACEGVAAGASSACWRVSRAGPAATPG
jgi:4'-phosphopantetheinyl transferase EntD